MVSEKDTLKSLYEIQMRTPVGIKQGTLKVEILNNATNRAFLWIY